MLAGYANFGNDRQGTYIAGFNQYQLLRSNDSGHAHSGTSSGTTVSKTPTLPLLNNLDGLKILQEIGADYRKFGTAILNDQKGTIIDIFEHDCNDYHKSDCINNEIAKKWLNGDKTFQETTWVALISVLCQIGKRNLALQISEILQISYNL